MCCLPQSPILPLETLTIRRKVVIILEELKLPYKIHKLELTEVKSDDYVKLNPNGRLPTILDPNTGITLWEVKLIPKSFFAVCNIQ